MFDVVAHAYVGGNCTEPKSYSEVDVTHGAVEMQIEHYTYGSCSPGGFTDFFVNISDRVTDDKYVCIIRFRLCF